MEKNFMIAISLILIIAFILWKLTIDHYKEELSEKMWKQWGGRLFYWQGVMYTSATIAIIIMFFLKWANVLTF